MRRTTLAVLFLATLGLAPTPAHAQQSIPVRIVFDDLYPGAALTSDGSGFYESIPVGNNKDLVRAVISTQNDDLLLRISPDSGRHLNLTLPVNSLALCDVLQASPDYAAIPWGTTVREYFLGVHDILSLPIGPTFRTTAVIGGFGSSPYYHQLRLGTTPFAFCSGKVSVTRLSGTTWVIESPSLLLPLSNDGIAVVVQSFGKKDGLQPVGYLNVPFKITVTQ